MPKLPPRKWTAARVDLLHREYPERDAAGLMDALNALPGAKLKSWEGIVKFANGENIRRTRKPEPRGFAVQQAKLQAERCTPAREAEFRRLRETSATNAETMESLNALPGLPFRFAYQLRAWARQLRLPPAPLRTTNREYQTKWTPARLAVLEAGVAAGRDWTDIFTEVNALPGLEVTHPRRVYDRAQDLGLLKLRPRGAAPTPYSPPLAQRMGRQAKPRQREAKVRVVTLRPAKPAPAPAPKALEPRPPKPGPVAPEVSAAIADVALAARMQRALAALRKVRDPDCVAIAHGCGLPPREVFRLRAELRSA